MAVDKNDLFVEKILMEKIDHRQHMTDLASSIGVELRNS
jgi:hypothetical protein